MDGGGQTHEQARSYGARVACGRQLALDGRILVNRRSIQGGQHRGRRARCGDGRTAVAVALARLAERIAAPVGSAPHAAMLWDSTAKSVATYATSSGGPGFACASRPRVSESRLARQTLVGNCAISGKASQAMSAGRCGMSLRTDTGDIPWQLDGAIELPTGLRRGGGSSSSARGSASSRSTPPPDGCSGTRCRPSTCRLSILLSRRSLTAQSPACIDARPALMVPSPGYRHAR